MGNLQNFCNIQIVLHKLYQGSSIPTTKPLWDFHSSNEEYDPLCCNAVCFTDSPTFQRNASPASTAFMPGILFTPEDGGDVSLQSCRLPQIYTVLQPRRQICFNCSSVQNSRKKHVIWYYWSKWYHFKFKDFI